MRLFCVLGLVLGLSLATGIAGADMRAQIAGADMLRYSDAGVAYVSGGLGKASRTEMDGQYGSYRFKLVTVAGRAYVSDAQVQIVDGNGRTVLDITLDGPWLLADLAPGAYKVQGMLDGVRRSADVHVVAGKTQRLVMNWPAQD